MTANQQIEVFQGDITRLKVDAIVNAANNTLLGGGGVDGAIHHAAGPDLLAECRPLQGCETGDAKITGGYRLPAAWVIHTVGPVWQGGVSREAQKLRSCYRRCFACASQKQVRSIAFPAISCGVYGYPAEQAVNIAVETVREALTQHPEIEKVIFCTFGDQMTALYQQALAQKQG